MKPYAFASLLCCLTGCIIYEEDEPTVADAGSEVAAESDSSTPPSASQPDAFVSPIPRACGAGKAIEVPPRWTCSPAQTASARGALARPAETAPALALREQLTTRTCEDLASNRRAALKSELHAQIDGLRRSALASCLPTVRYEGGQNCVATLDAGTSIASRGPQASAPSADSAGATTYSTTNTQVADVDEADFVKNDAGYVYVLSQQSLHVIDAWPAEQTHEVKRVALDGTPTRLFLHEGKLVVYLRTAAAQGRTSPCTYGYDCRATAEEGSTSIVVYDVSLPEAPHELRRYDLSGGYLSSRRIGNSVHTVVLDRGPQGVPGVTLSAISAADPDAVDAEYQRRVAAADQAVDALDVSHFFPRMSHREAGQPATTEPAGCVLLSASAADGTQLTSLVSFDLTSPAAPTRTMIASSPGFVYASSEALYIAADGVGGSSSFRYLPNAPDELSTLHKFALSGTSARYAGSAKVAGHVLNQFSMDERAGVLRVATSLGKVPSPNVSSSITTFAEQSGGFVQLGAVTGIAPQEDIRSVRFDDDRAFIVTFKKTDPLFAIGLSDPAQPKVLGELKIPGFSTYMHSLDRNHLLAVGFDADEQGSFAYFNGIQIQIFDVTDLSAPKLLHKSSIGTRGSASEGLLNHLAFNYFPAKKMLALPMTICDGGGNGRSGDRLTFSGLMVFDVSLEQGIREHGRMPFIDAATASNVGSCGSWWSSGRSLVRRSIFMDDFAVALSDAQYQVAALADLSRPLRVLSLAAS